MTTKQIIELQRHINTIPDGFWGPKSTRAAQLHLLKLMPNPHPFPTAHQIRRNTSNFGHIGQPATTLIHLPFTIYYGSIPVNNLYPNSACADQLLSVFQRLAEVYPDEQSRRKAGILTYDGLYNNRPVRGGRIPSLHAFAAAIDLDAAHNRNKSHWPVNSRMPIQVMECFVTFGFLPAGAFWSRDAMHFQATKP